MYVCVCFSLVIIVSIDIVNFSDPTLLGMSCAIGIFRAVLMGDEIFPIIKATRMAKK